MIFFALHLDLCFWNKHTIQHIAIKKCQLILIEPFCKLVFCSLEVAPVIVPTDLEISRMIIFTSSLKTWVETCFDTDPKIILFAASSHLP